MPTCDLNRFQGIFQICANCCIPASIENVVRYYGEIFSQREFLNNFLKDYNMIDLHFQKIKEFLDNDPFFIKNFECEHKTIKEHRSNDELIEYLRNCIANNSPVIVALKQETQNEINRHIVTVYYIEGNKISYFDSNPRFGGFVEFIQINKFKELFAKGLGTLLIKRK